MRFRFSILPLLTFATSVWAEPSCSLVTLNVPVSALNLQLPSNYSGLTTQALNALPRVQISDTYKIAARYCEPEKHVASRSSTLQILVHGVTYTKDYWSGLGPPGQGYDGDKYSYVEYASQQGYPTLAIDRICNGDSDKPNGLLVCQLPVNMEVLYQIVLQVRSTAVVGRRKFDKVIPVCHSEGSTICQYLMQIHPTAPISTYVVTAFTDAFLIGGAGSVAAVGFVPANVAKPSSFGNLDPTYLLTTNARGAQGVFYYGDYDPQLSAYDFSHTHPVPAGEIATSALSQLPAPNYVGSLLLLNGANDQIFCAVLPTDPLLGFRGNCGSGPTSTTAQSKVLFPKASFHWQQVANTGHDLHLHLTAPQTWKITNDYLISQGF